VGGALSAEAIVDFSPTDGLRIIDPRVVHAAQGPDERVADHLQIPQRQRALVELALGDALLMTARTRASMRSGSGPAGADHGLDESAIMTMAVSRDWGLGPG
jgi:hypothetical protein